MTYYNAHEQTRLANQVDHDTLVRAARMLAESNFGSTSMLQRKLRIGFAAVCTLMDALECAGIATDVGNPLRTRQVNILDVDIAAKQATDWWHQHANN